MTKRHTILLVEDDQEFADEIVDLLESLGHDCIHRTNAKEALAIVQQGGFCCAMYDLQIFAGSDSIKPRVESGLTLASGTRQHYPNKNLGGFHCLPILCMSGHAKELDLIMELISSGVANSFIKKPLG
ncbi:response regulator, partial [bacterium]|nr:response regulator [bacterium]